MKTFLKTFIVSLLFFLVAYGLGSMYSLRNHNIKFGNDISQGEKLNTNIINTQEGEPERKEPAAFEDLDTAFEESHRVNFLILGLEDIRTDTMILASFDKDAKILDLISIPRDTYIHRSGYDKGPQRKINAIYHVNGIEGVKQAVKYILDVPIDNHIIIDFDGVKEVVDLVGGVEVDVPFHMKYKDIDLKPGKQVLDGEKALGFIRWRKNDDNRNSYIDGDLGRIKAQHEFLKSLLSKSKEHMVPLVRTGFKYVETDLNIFETMMLANDGKDIDDTNTRFYTIPGEHEFRTIDGTVNSYYIFNADETEELIKEIYNVRTQKNHPQG